jgi:hypothetical protein
MGAVSSPRLALSVADAGGVGTVTALNMDAARLARQLDDMTPRTRGVLSVNFLTEDVDERAVRVAAEGVRLVDFFWLDPRPRLVELVHGAGALVGWQVGSVEEASAAEDAGCDVVTVQGVEAGGHIRGRMPLMALLGAVLQVVRIPVLAAGGIADGPTFAAVLADSSRQRSRARTRPTSRRSSMRQGSRRSSAMPSPSVHCARPAGVPGCCAAPSTGWQRGARTSSGRRRWAVPRFRCRADRACPRPPRSRGTSMPWRSTPERVSAWWRTSDPRPMSSPTWSRTRSVPLLTSLVGEAPGVAGEALHPDLVGDLPSLRSLHGR